MKKQVCPGGGIGRRTRFRCERSKILGSSSLLLGTICFFTGFCSAVDLPTFTMSSDNIVVDTSRRMCCLDGHAQVSVTRHDDKYDFAATKIEILYSKGKSNLPRKITAFGFVKFTYGDIKISSTTCKYDTQKILFEDQVLIVDKNLGTIRADKATYDVKTKKIEIISKDKVRINISKSL